MGKAAKVDREAVKADHRNMRRVLPSPKEQAQRKAQKNKR